MCICSNNQSWISVGSDLAPVISAVAAIVAIVISVKSYKKTTHELLKAPDVFLNLSPKSTKTPVSRKLLLAYENAKDWSKEEVLLLKMQNRGKRVATNIKVQLMLDRRMVHLPAGLDKINKKWHDLLKEQAVYVYEYFDYYLDISEDDSATIGEVKMQFHKGKGLQKIGAYLIKANNMPRRLQDVFINFDTKEIVMKKRDLQEGGTFIL